MKIIVCMKQIPASPDVNMTKKGTLVRESSDWMVSKEDQVALEAALRIKDNNPNVTINIITMGNETAKALLYEGLGKGADNGYLITDPAFAESDSYTTSMILAKAIKQLPYDLIFCGFRSSDSGTANVPGQIAAQLKLPQLIQVTEFVVKDKKIAFRSAMDYGYIEGEAILPLVVSFDRNAFHPRLPNMKLLFSAYNSERITTWNNKDLGFPKENVGWNGSLVHIVDTFVPVEENEGILFEGEPEESVDKLIAQLHRDRII